MSFSPNVTYTTSLPMNGLIALDHQHMLKLIALDHQHMLKLIALDHQHML